MRVPFWLLCIALLWTGQPASAATTLEQQRLLFQQARSALARHDMARAQTLRRKLGGYPLAPYIDIRIAQHRMAAGDDTMVAEAIARYPDIPESRDLHLAWIKNLAKRGQWPAVAEQLTRLPAAAVRYPRIAMQAAFYSGNRADAVARFSRYWQRGGRITHALAPIARAWRRAGNPTNQARWQRITRLMPQGKWRLVRPLLTHLRATDRQLVAHWHRGQRHPDTVLARWPLPSRPSAHEAQVLTRLLRRLSLREPESAWHYATRLQLAFDHRQWLALQRNLALRAARHQLPVAATWLAQLPDAAQNDATRGWRTRLLLQARDWRGVLQAISAMPDRQRRQPEWAYWQARALEQVGKPDAAKLLFAVLAQERGYFSFLSAERLHIPYQIASRPADVDHKLLKNLQRIPGIVRAHEWLVLGLQSKARREWFRALQEMTPAKWRAAAALASGWGWYDRAILAALRGRAIDALEQRFPLAYSRHVRRAAKSSGLAPSLIWSIIRQESAFNAQAISPAGAKGLMQLRPRTAAMVAKRHHARHTPNLFDAATNIRLGSHYLASIKRRFDGSVPLATAAYNAGPARVNRWLKRQPYREGDLWIASIPFRETRNYVQHVLAYSILYDWRQGKRHPLSISRQLSTPIHLASAR